MFKQFLLLIFLISTLQASALELKKTLNSEHLEGMRTAIESRNDPINDQDYILSLGGSYEKLAELSDAEELNAVMNKADFFDGNAKTVKYVVRYEEAKKTSDIKDAGKMLKRFFKNMKDMADRNQHNSDLVKSVLNMISDTTVETNALLTDVKSEVRLMKSDLYEIGDKEEDDDIDSEGYTYIAIDKETKEFVLIIDMSYLD